jgi:hypothetical protein
LGFRAASVSRVTRASTMTAATPKIGAIHAMSVDRFTSCGRTVRVAVIMTHARPAGMKTFQPIRISRS